MKLEQALEKMTKGNQLRISRGDSNNEKDIIDKITELENRGTNAASSINTPSGNHADFEPCASSNIREYVECMQGEESANIEGVYV